MFFGKKNFCKSRDAVVVAVYVVDLQYYDVL